MASYELVRTLGTGSFGRVFLVRERLRPDNYAALKILENALGADHSSVATCLLNLSTVVMHQEDYDEARRHLERALRVQRAALDEDHPSISYTLLNLAKVAMIQEDFDAARVHAERAVPIFERSGIAPEMLASARFMLARALWPDRSERPRARELAQQARDALTQIEHGSKFGLAGMEAWLAEHP